MDIDDTAHIDSPEKKSAKKSDRAFRTISEVADLFGLPQHVLRFWETKFPQLRPMKRGGGRRYYRPDDVALVERIKGLLHNDGYTIKGVQKLLREGGAKTTPTAEVIVEAPAAHTSPAATTDEAALSPETRAELAAVLADLKDLRGLLAAQTS